jgi:hypothetical protein
LPQTTERSLGNWQAAGRNSADDMVSDYSCLKCSTFRNKAIVMFFICFASFENPKTYQPAREKNKQEKITKYMHIF